MSEPSQLFEALVYAKRIKHNGNPVLRWNVQNAGLERSRNMRMIYPKKVNQRKRIDGVTACIMALNRAMVDGGEGSMKYEPVLSVGR
jgi:phage terminase large subunit-like protein